MFPKAPPTEYLSTPTISAVVQDQNDYRVTYTLGATQSFSPITVEFLEDDVVIDSFTLGASTAVWTIIGEATREFPSYTEGAIIKVRVTNATGTKTSNGTEATYPRLEGLPSITSFSGVCTRDIMDGTYSWYGDFSPYPVLDEGYYNQSIAISLETFESGVWTQRGLTRFISFQPDENDYSFGPYTEPSADSPTAARIRVLISAAGYSHETVATVPGL